MSEIKYLDYAGLTKFKEEIDNVILANKNDIVGTINTLSGDIGNGTLTIKKNNTSVGTFTANQKTDSEVNISVPTNLSDLTFDQTVINEIINIIKYGQLDVSESTAEQKAALHETIATNFGYLSPSALATSLSSYGTTINYDSATQKVQLKNGGNVLSEFSAAAFIKDGMVSSVSITDGTGDNLNKKVLLIDFNTDSNITDIEIPIEDIFDASQYTKTSDLATVATSGDYDDLTNKPDLSGFITQSDLSGITNTTYKLTIGSTTNGDSTNGVDLGTLESKTAVVNGSDLSLVTTGEKATWNAKSNFSGSYSDLSDKPTIPTVNDGTFSIKTKVGDNNAVTAADFTANQSGTDDITLVQGNNVTLTTDTTNRTITIASTDTTYSEATTSAAGLMSSSDKTKLNGIETNADVTDAENVKAALNIVTTSAGKYLKDDGTWDTPQSTTYVFNTAYDATTNKVATMADIPSSLPANGGNSATVNNHTVAVDVPSNAVFTDTTYSVMGASGSTHASGLVPDTPTTAGTSKYLREDGTWTEPSITYSNTGFTVNAANNSSTTLSLDGTIPIHVVTTTANITAITLSTNPAEGHSCHVIITASSEKTVSITHHSTNRICPGGEDPEPLTIPAGGYIELDFLTANNKVYVRGI